MTATGTRRVAIGGASYLAPYADLFRPLTPDERAALEQSVRDDGVLHPVATCTVPGLGRVLVDGGHRAEACQRLGLDCPRVDLGELAEADARRLALDLNSARRQLSPGELERARRQRVARVAAARAAGLSLRAIAAAEGVSPEQVRRDARAAGASPVTPGPGSEGEGEDSRPAAPPPPPAPAPAVVNGRDGKAYRQAPPADPGRLAARKARECLRAALKAVDELAEGDRAGHLAAAAARHGVPLRDGAWPALLAVEAALAEVAAADGAW